MEEMVCMAGNFPLDEEENGLKLMMGQTGALDMLPEEVMWNLSQDESYYQRNIRDAIQRVKSTEAVLKKWFFNIGRR